MSDKKLGFLLVLESQTPQNRAKIVILGIVILEVSDHSESIGIVDFFRVSGQVRRVASLVPPRRVRT